MNTTIDGHSRTADDTSSADMNIKDVMRFFDISRDILCIFSFEGTFRTLNPAFTRILGWTLEEAMQKPWLEFIHPDDLKKAAQAADELKLGVAMNSFRIRSLHKNGSYRSISWNSQPIKEEGLIFSVGRDITELSQAEDDMSISYHELEERVSERTSALNVVNEQLTKEIQRCAQIELELLEREARLQEAQRIAHVGSWDYDVSTNRLNWSDEIFRIFEVDPDKFGASYESFLDMIHPDDRDLVDRAYISSLQNKTPYEIGHRLRFPDGRIKYVHEKAQTFSDDSGRALRSVGTVQDVTDQKRFEMSLSESEANLRSILDSVPGVMMLVKREGTLLSVNRHFLQQFNVEETYCLGRSVFEFLAPETKDKRRQWLERIFTTGQPQELEDAREDRQIHAYGYPVVDGQGMVDRVAIYAADVTELNKAAESSKLLAAVVEHGADSVVVTDTQGVIKYVTLHSNVPVAIHNMRPSVQGLTY